MEKHMPTEKYTWLITGGAGFIGSHLAKALVARGQHVRVLDDFSAGNPQNLLPLRDQISLIQGNICDMQVVLQACKGADYVLHHAALVSVPQSVAYPRETLQTNIQGTACVLEAARQCGVRRLVFASSCAVYGDAGQTPLAETAPQNPLSPYALSKQAGMALCRLYTKVYGLDTVSLVYFNVFGDGQNASSPYAAVIAHFLQEAANGRGLTICGDGLQSRDFVHVRDVVQANLLAAQKGKAGEIYNVGSGRSISVLQLADIIEKISGLRAERTFLPARRGDIRFSAADIGKIRALGFAPSSSLEADLRMLWDSLSK